MSRPAPTKSSPIDLNDKHDKADVLGTLIVVLLKARNLNDKHSFRKSDVFAQAILNGVQKRTHVEIKGGQHPEWDGEVRFPILKYTGEKYRKMEVACYSMEPRSEDLMGKGIVDITETLKTGEFDDWVQLEVDGVARGELYLEMTYYANAPAPAAHNNKMLTPLINQNAGLARHPSKLSPAERLSRPQQQHNRPINQVPTQGYPQHRPQGGAASSFVPTHSSRLSEGKITAQHDVSNMPGSYPEHSNTSHRRTSDALPDIPVSDPRPRAGSQNQILQSAAPLPAILRPGQGISVSSAGPPQRPQNGSSHVRRSSESHLQPDADGSQSSPPSYNPYLGVSGVPSTSVSQSSSPQSRQGFSPLNPANPYLIGTSPPAPGQVSPHGHSPAGSNRPISTAPPQGLASSTITSPHAQNPYSGHRLGIQTGGSAPLLWQDNTGLNSAPSNGSFSFPTPSIIPAYNDNAQLAYNQRPAESSHSRINSYELRPNPSKDDKFDPYLQARYQSPLPLPPGGERPISARHTPQPELAQASKPYPMAPTPSNITSPVVDNSRLEALRRAEEDAARRREQELKDLELALQLDRELNLAEERAAAH